MNVLDTIKAFFRRDTVKAILKTALSLLKLLLGKVAKDLQEIALEEVQKAEATGATGQKKYEMAYEGIKNRLPGLRESAINLAIELAVSALQAQR